MFTLLLFAALNQPLQANRIVVKKSDHTLTLYHGETKLRSYRVSLGSHAGQKRESGDRRTPEGIYFIDARNSDSRFHRALHLSYPNTQDRQRAQSIGKSPGGDIEIHGYMDGFAWLGPLARHVDWTAGCIALTNEELDEIWPLVPVGTAVDIEP